MPLRPRRRVLPVLLVLTAQLLTGCFAGEVAVRERAAMLSWRAVVASATGLAEGIEAFGPTGLPADALRLPATAQAVTDESSPGRLPSPRETEVLAERISSEVAALGRLDISLRAALGLDATAKTKLRDVSRLLALSERIRVAAAIYDRRAAAFNVARSGVPGRWWGQVAGWAPAQAGLMLLDADVRPGVDPAGGRRGGDG